MSFFADLMAGSIAGLGKGITDEAAYQDKLDAQNAMRLQQQQFQAQMQQDKLDAAAQRQQDRLDAKASGGSGGTNIWDEFSAAQNDPQKASNLIARLSLLGDNAQALGAKVLGRGGVDDPNHMPTDQDVRDAEAYTGKPMPPVDPEKAAMMAEKGRLEFARGFALLANKGNIDGYAKGERELFGNDAAQKEYRQMLEDGYSIEEANDMLTKRLNPAKLDPLAEERLRLQREEADRKARAAADGNEARSKKLLIDELKANNNKLDKGGFVMPEAESAPLKARNAQILDLLANGGAASYPATTSSPASQSSTPATPATQSSTRAPSTSKAAVSAAINKFKGAR